MHVCCTRRRVGLWCWCRCRCSWFLATRRCGAVCKRALLSPLACAARALHLVGICSSPRPPLPPFDAPSLRLCFCPVPPSMYPLLADDTFFVLSFSASDVPFFWLVCLVFGGLRTSGVAVQPGRQGDALAAQGRHAGTGVCTVHRVPCGGGVLVPGTPGFKTCDLVPCYVSRASIDRRRV